MYVTIIKYNISMDIWICMFKCFFFFASVWGRLIGNAKNKIKIQAKKKIHLPKCSHGNDSIPESCRNTGELAGCGAFLCVEHHCSKDDNGHGQREKQES